MRIKLLYAFLCLLLIIFTLNRNSYDGTRSVYNPIPQITLPEGINHLFDNSVSFPAAQAFQFLPMLFR